MVIYVYKWYWSIIFLCIYMRKITNWLKLWMIFQFSFEYPIGYIFSEKFYFLSFVVFLFCRWWYFHCEGIAICVLKNIYSGLEQLGSSLGSYPKGRQFKSVIRNYSSNLKEEIYTERSENYKADFKTRNWQIAKRRHNQKYS